MNSFRAIIDLWPTKSALAVDIGATPQHVSNMYARDLIPARYWAAAVDSAVRRGITGVTLEVMASLAASRREAA